MPKTNHLDIYKCLNKSNCRKCGIPTCMAFALAVIKGDKDIKDCPFINKEDAIELDSTIEKRDTDRENEATIGPLKQALSDVDFSAAAAGLGAEVVDERLKIKCLGKDFYVDNNGNLESIVHINTWVMMPLFKYIITGGNRPISGKWISFEELHQGTNMAKYFNRRCEEPMRQLAEAHTDIFFDLLNIFGGQKVEGNTADYSIVIRPLPKIPVLILYWKPEEQFESKLKVLFDSTANTYLDTHSIYVLGRGIVEMFKRILSRHEELIPALLSL